MDLNVDFNVNIEMIRVSERVVEKRSISIAQNHRTGENQGQRKCNCV